MAMETAANPDIFDSLTEELLPVPEVKNLGTSYLEFDGLLKKPGLKVYEDGGAAGCGGKLWPAGELLSRYMIRRGVGNYKNIVELGSGTGLVGYECWHPRKFSVTDEKVAWQSHYMKRIMMT